MKVMYTRSICTYIYAYTLIQQRAVVEQLVPPKSFIAADDFNTTKELATYLHYLMRNKSAYA
ncbi:hypothetical protein ANCCAN_28987 [Ancylostoma caninum]|uniref:Fucosyltransferase n=1 Tax=Ancylostoma caninum TaxID=29170 RepID=A0A368EZN9_ANCCA|nr:hypothetical protein ANCCAN_28987 [Ancylostoma caninum]